MWHHRIESYSACFHSIDWTPPLNFVVNAIEKKVFDETLDLIENVYPTLTISKLMQLMSISRETALQS